jgi:maltose alpha-D-glucosyltransferase/alpha-amylase
MGVDGFRLDAIPYLIERDGTNNENLPETHEVIKQLRARASTRYPGRMLLAEANSGPRTCASTSATATSATWRTTSR